MDEEFGAFTFDLFDFLQFFENDDLFENGDFSENVNDSQIDTRFKNEIEFATIGKTNL